MKNHRAKLVATTLVLLLLIGLGSAIQWYRSGAAPEPPSSFFEARDVQRALARLESHRLDQQERLNTCSTITNHIERAKRISFTNPAQALDSIRALRTDLASIAVPEEGPWHNAVIRFAQSANSACAEAEELTQILEHTDWSALSVPVLERRIVRAKELAASMQKYPPWQSNEELRTTLYPAFEQAYRHRGEQDPDVLKSRLFAPGPALTRWYYARLLEDRSGLPKPICASTLETQYLALALTRKELVQTDAQSVFLNWTFPTTRADHLARLTEIVRALEQSKNLLDWLAAAELQSDARRHLTQQTRAGSETPDPRIRVVVAEIDVLVTNIQRIEQTFSFVSNLESLALLAESLRQISSQHPGFAACTLAPLQRTRDTANVVCRAAQSLLDSPEASVDPFAQVQLDSIAFSAALGIDVTEPLLVVTFDRWCSRQWPPVSQLGNVAALIRRLGKEAVLPTLALSGVADVLDDIAASVTTDQRSQLTQDWETRVRPRLTAHPALVRRIDHSLRSLEELILEDELRRLIRQGDESAIRKAARRILDRPASPRWAQLQTAAREILMAMDLSANRDRLTYESLGQLQPSNPEWIPPSPPESSVQSLLFDQRVRPLLDYALAIHHLEGDEGDCAIHIETAYRNRRELLQHDTAWNVLDNRFLSELVSSATLCLPPVPASLDLIEKAIQDLLQPDGGSNAERNERLTLYHETVLQMGQLLASTPQSPEYRQALSNLVAHVEMLGGADRNLVRYIQFRELHADLLASLDQATHSFQRMRHIIDDRFHGQPLDSELEELSMVLRSGLNRLQSVVERDRYAVRHRSGVAHLTDIAADYNRIAHNDTTPPALASYAKAQAACLLTYTLPSDYRFQLHPEHGKTFSVAYSRLGNHVESLGYGRRLKGRGDNLQIWVRTGGPAVPILRGDWKDDPEAGRLRVSDLEAIPGTNSWHWDVPVEVGIRVAHTLNPDKDLVPDAHSSRSRWNPLNYGVYRAETQEYAVATFSSLEGLLRKQLASPNHAQGIVLDNLFDPEALESQALRFIVEGIPPGRDFDWPKTFAPQTTDDMRRLRTDIESSVSNLVEDLLGK